MDAIKYKKDSRTSREALCRFWLLNFKKKAQFEFQVNKYCWNRREVYWKVKAKIRNEINNNNKQRRRGTCSFKIVPKERCFPDFTSKLRLNLSQNAFKNVLNSSELCFRL